MNKNKAEFAHAPLPSGRGRERVKQLPHSNQGSGTRYMATRIFSCFFSHNFSFCHESRKVSGADW